VKISEMAMMKSLERSFYIDVQNVGSQIKTCGRNGRLKNRLDPFLDSSHDQTHHSTDHFGVKF
jgi:hypothetical protein